MNDRDQHGPHAAAESRDAPIEPAKRDATYADVERLPPEVNGEIVAGALWVSPRPALTHAATSSRALIALGSGFGQGPTGPGGWHILHEPELHLGDDVLVPDLAGWRVERMPFIPRAPFADLAPDWICEVVSPSTARLDRTAKLPRYHLHGVQWSWILDPIARTLEVYEHSDAGYVLVQTFEADALARACPFDAIEIELGRWWLPDPPG